MFVGSGDEGFSILCGCSHLFGDFVCCVVVVRFVVGCFVVVVVAVVVFVFCGAGAVVLFVATAVAVCWLPPLQDHLIRHLLRDQVSVSFLRCGERPKVASFRAVPTIDVPLGGYRLFFPFAAGWLFSFRGGWVGCGGGVRWGILFLLYVTVLYSSTCHICDGVADMVVR